MSNHVRYRARFRLSVKDGCAYQEVDGLYLSIEEHEEILQRQAEQLAEAARLLIIATTRYPQSALTEPQCRDAHRWLVKYEDTQ